MGSAPRFRRWWAFALILPNVPIVLYAMLRYEEGGLYQLAITLCRWSVFTLLYWLPLGWLLLYPNRTLVGILRTYLISIPLFFLCLTFSLPLFGFQLHPHGIGMWLALFAAGLVMFLFVLLAVSITGLRTAWFRAALVLSLVLFAAETAWPVSIWLTTDKYTWPSSLPGSFNLANVRIVDVEHGTVRDNLHLHVRDGKIVEIVGAQGDQTPLPMLDATGKYLMPGLIDVHAHTWIHLFVHSRLSSISRISLSRSSPVFPTTDVLTLKQASPQSATVEAPPTISRYGKPPSTNKSYWARASLLSAV